VLLRKSFSGREDNWAFELPNSQSVVRGLRVGDTSVSKRYLFLRYQHRRSRGTAALPQYHKPRYYLMVLTDK